MGTFSARKSTSTTSSKSTIAPPSLHILDILEPESVHEYLSEITILTNFNQSDYSMSIQTFVFDLEYLKDVTICYLLTSGLAY